MNEQNLTEEKKEHRQKMYRAKYLIYDYKKEDIKYNRETPNFDSKWVLENIFSKSCVYCGESDWHKLGCDRKNNSIGHIKNNVVPCCLHCNMTKPKEEQWKPKYAEKRKKALMQIKPNGEIVKYSCSIDCIKDGYNANCVRKACNGLLKTYKGSRLEYITE